MAEYIEREAAIKAIEEVVSAMESWVTEYQAQRRGLMTAIVIVDDVPAADVAPVRHGRWVMNDQSTLVCSRCGNVVAFVSHPDRKWDFGNYCPNCGAKMDGDVNGGTDNR